MTMVRKLEFWQAVWTLNIICECIRNALFRFEVYLQSGTDLNHGDTHRSLVLYVNRHLLRSLVLPGDSQSSLVPWRRLEHFGAGKKQQRRITILICGAFVISAYQFTVAFLVFLSKEKNILCTSICINLRRPLHFMGQDSVHFNHPWPILLNLFLKDSADRMAMSTTYLLLGHLTSDLPYSDLGDYMLSSSWSTLATFPRNVLWFSFLGKESISHAPDLLQNRSQTTIMKDWEIRRRKQSLDPL